MKFLSSLSSKPGMGFLPKENAEIGKLREKLLAVLLYVALGPGLAVYYISIRDAVALREWGLVAFYTIVFGWVMAITFYRRLSYNLRAGSLVGILYMLGVGVSILYGLGGDGRIWMLGFTALTSIFFSPQLSIIITLLGTVSLAGIGWALNQGLISTQTLFLYPVSSWIPTVITFLLVSLIIGGTTGYLLAILAERLVRERDLSDELEHDRQELREKATGLERRQRQLRTAADISQTIAAELDPLTLFQQTVNLLTKRFGLYYAGVFVVDEEEQYAILQAGSGEAGQAMLAEKHQLIIGGSSMIGWTIAHKQPRIALDVGREAVRFDNPHLPLTRSELALPMTSRGRALGALTIQSAEAEAFDEDDITILQTIADSLATALENAQLYQQSQSNLGEIRTLHRQYLQQAWETVAQNRTDLEYAFESEQLSQYEGELSIIEAPLILRGQQIGNLVLKTDNPELTAEEESMLNAITTQAALALENARLIEEAQKRSQQDRIVSEIAGKVQRATKIDEALKTTLRELGQTLGASEGTIHLEIRE